MVWKRVDDQSLPFVSFVIPTYNAEKTLKRCLDSIIAQNYPTSKYEVIVVDGGSTDHTVGIAGNYGAKILFNRRRYEDGKEGGKAIGVDFAIGELVAFVDADNYLCSKSWLRNMVRPFLVDPEVVACETSRCLDRRDPAINRYCSCLVTYTPLRDPFSLSQVGRDRAVSKSEKDFYIYDANIANLLSVSNGTIARRSVVQKLGGFDYDIDLVLRMLDNGFNRFARVANAGIYHSYVLSFGEFIKKGVKRARFFVRKLLERRKVVEFYFPSDRRARFRLVLTLVSGLTFIWPTCYSARKFTQRRDWAWIYHPITRFVTILIYLFVIVTDRKALSTLLRALLRKW